MMADVGLAQWLRKYRAFAAQLGSPTFDFVPASWTYNSDRETIRLERRLVLQF